MCVCVCVCWGGGGGGLKNILKFCIKFNTNNMQCKV